MQYFARRETLDGKRDDALEYLEVRPERLKLLRGTHDASWKIKRTWNSIGFLEVGLNE
jgi:hypothetical protein